MFRSGKVAKHAANCKWQLGTSSPPTMHNLHPGLGSYEHVPTELVVFEGWRRAIDSHLDAHDHARFVRATGTSIRELLDDPAWRRSDPDHAAVLARVMGNEKFVPHALNAKGLHALRALLAERMTHRRQRRSPLARHPWFERVHRDGLLVLPNIRANLSADVRGEGMAAPGGGRLEHPAMARFGGSVIGGLLRSLSGYRYLDLEGFDDWARHVHYRADAQTWMHVDTFLPTWKVWIFQETPARAGPFTFVRGSHRNTEHKLRWLFNRSRRYVSQQSLDELRNPNVNAKRLPRVLPWSDEVFGFDPAVRVEGFEPGHSGQADVLLRQLGFEPPVPVVTQRGWTLVIADTSGLHSRGWAQPGEVRISSVLRSSLAGEDFMPRKNVFFCERQPEEC